VGGERKMYTQSGISLRYVFEKRPIFNKKKKKKDDKEKFNWKFWEKKKEKEKKEKNWKFWEKE